jgi:cell division protein FtsI (penicillin-binding protein 3)
MSRRSIPYANSPLLTQRTPLWRSRFVLALLALAFVGLIARAVYVQVLNNDFIQEQGDARMQRTIALEPSRGRILDRNGLILAASVPAYSLWIDNADPNLPGWREVAKILGRDLKQLRQTVSQRQGKGFTWMAHQLDEVQGQAIAKLDMPGVFLNHAYKRAYPEGEAAAHILGFTNVENNGQEGVELAFNEQLSGHAGSRRVLKDRLGHIIEDVRDIVPPVNGKDVQLSIDSKVQFFAYDRIKAAVQKHNANSGSVVVLDAQTGEVLALANYPSYDPNDRSTLRGSSLRNRAITDAFEPGSTVKPLIVGLAIQEKLIKPSTTFNTAPGYMFIGRSRISDSHPHGVLTVSEIIEKSSNVGTVKISEQLSPQTMWNMYSEVGLGQRPPLPFPGITRGSLRAYESWRPIEKATMSYGYGLSTSLLQLARAYTVFAGDGHLANISLIKTQSSAPGPRVFDPAVAKQLRSMLGLVTGDEGTAPRAQTVGYSVGGKTGTAHKLEGGKYADKKYRGFFVGLAPIDQPRIIVAVMLDEPKGREYFGGLVAAPVFSETVQQTLRILGVTPDMSVQPNIHAQGVEESL